MNVVYIFVKDFGVLTSDYIFPLRCGYHNVQVDDKFWANRLGRLASWPLLILALGVEDRQQGGIEAKLDGLCVNMGHLTGYQDFIPKYCILLQFRLPLLTSLPQLPAHPPSSQSSRQTHFWHPYRRTEWRALPASDLGFRRKRNTPSGI